MKKNLKIMLLICLCMAASLMPAQEVKSQIPIIELIKDAAKKIIKAIDLQVQRLQNKTIDLQNVQKQIENTLSKLKLQEIADWTQKQKDLYQKYFDELWQVKSLIAYYRRITDIIDKQKQLVAEYKQASVLLQQDKHFSAEEIDDIHVIYGNIIDKSVESLDQILLLIQSFTVQMSDAQRLELLNHSADEIETCISHLRTFTNQNIQLSLQRAKELNDVAAIKKLYGLD